MVRRIDQALDIGAGRQIDLTIDLANDHLAANRHRPFGRCSRRRLRFLSQKGWTEENGQEGQADDETPRRRTPHALHLTSNGVEPAVRIRPSEGLHRLRDPAPGPCH